MASLPKATQAGQVELLNYDDDYRATKQRADLPLESGDVAVITARALDEVHKLHLLLPEAEVLIERAVVALLGGHIVLAGPPGTGKTTLAHILARAFQCSETTVTATADWSAFDVIGGLQPTMVGTGDLASEILRPWLGHVPRAAVECANAIARHADNAQTAPQQAHWLIIDEFSRAEIDKAIGPLYTALGGGDRRVPLWFGDAEERQEVWLPSRFRLVGTMNSVDTAYVFSFSQGLTRRFQFIYVGVPQREQVPDELRQASIQAAEWYGITYGGAVPSDATALAAKSDEFLQDARVVHATSLLTKLLEFVRYGDDARPGWPIGTAQIVDVFRQVALRRASAPNAADGLVGPLDLAIADRLVPQMDQLLRTQLDAFEERLREADLVGLERTRRALGQIREAQNTAFA